MLPPDRHVHTEWSWDAPNGSMERTCARAVELGLSSIAFTDHADWTGWYVGPDAPFPPPSLAAQVDDDHVFVPPPLDLDGYLAELERCRARYPGLEILSGVELSEPHRHPEAAADLLARGRFDVVVGGMHSLPDGDHFVEAGRSHATRAPEDVQRTYLAEVLAMIEADPPFATLAHIDYPARRWPSGSTFRAEDWEDEYRPVLRALAGSGRALEINTRRPLEAAVVRWWREEGGDAVSFGSDAHDPLSLAHGFEQAAATAEAAGFRPGPHRHGFWPRA